MPADTIVGLLEGAAEKYPTNRCMTYRHDGGREDYSYAEVLDLARRFAGALRARGVERGDRVVIWGPSRPEWGIAYFGILMLGGIVVPFDTRAAESFLERVETKTEPKLAIAGRAQQQGAKIAHAAYLDIEDVVAEAHAHQPPADLRPSSPDDIAVLMYTSGTTGDPKGVVLTHGNVAANMRAVPEIIVIEPHFRLLSLLPLSHILEQVVGLMVPMLGGASIVYVDTLKPQVIFDTMVEEGVTMMIAVPQLLQLFMSGIEREVRRQGKERVWNLLHGIARRLPFGLRHYLFGTIHKKLGGKFEFFAVGGAYLPPDLAQRWENMGIKVLQGYGLTENSPIVSANSLDRRKLDSIGRVVSNLQVRLADDGEILIKGPSVFQGYWQDPAATAEAFEDGWYHTGDVARMDAEGYLYFTGRKKNVIVLANGMNVHAEDVENAVRSTGLVIDAVVVGQNDLSGDVEVHAVLVLEDPAQAEAAVDRANKVLAPHQRIRSHSVWADPDFPRTHTLKVKRPEVEKRLRVHVPSPSGRGPG